MLCLSKVCVNVATVPSLRMGPTREVYFRFSRETLNRRAVVIYGNKLEVFVRLACAA